MNKDSVGIQHTRRIPAGRASGKHLGIVLCVLLGGCLVISLVALYMAHTAFTSSKALESRLVINPLIVQNSHAGPAVFASAKDKSVSLSVARLPGKDGFSFEIPPVGHALPSFQMLSDNGKAIFEVTRKDGGQPRVYLRDSKGEPRVVIGIDNTDTPFISLLDGHGTQRVVLGSPTMVSSDGIGPGTTSLYTFGEDGRLTFSAVKGKR